MNRIGSIWKGMPLGIKGATVTGAFTISCFGLAHLADYRERAANQVRYQQRIQRDRNAHPGMTIDRAVTESTVKCFMDVEIGDVGEVKQVGRIEYTLFDSVCPKTADNFRLLCRNECREIVA